jgi:hypothetical protein
MIYSNFPTIIGLLCQDLTELLLLYACEQIGLRSSTIKIPVLLGIIIVRYILLPVIGIWIVKGAGQLGFLPPDPLFKFVLMVQYTLPPAMNIGKQAITLTIC